MLREIGYVAGVVLCLSLTMKAVKKSSLAPFDFATLRVSGNMIPH